MSYFFYILLSERDSSYYIGQTKKLHNRVRRHQQGRSRYTRGRRPWRRVYSEEFATRSKAVRREKLHPTD